MMTTFRQDITYGFRMLIKKPGFTIAAVLSLALGIGANTTIFSIVNATLLSSLSYPEPDRLMVLWSVPTDAPENRSSVTAFHYRAWQERSKSFRGIGAYYGMAGNLGGDGSGAYAEAIGIELFTYSMWDVLGAKPLHGRVFTQDEDQDGNAARVAVLSYPFWQRRFGGSPDAVGRSIRVDGQPVTVIGVMPEGFQFADNDSAYWAPMGFSPQQLNSAASFLVVVGRLADGAGIERARTEMDSIAAGLREAFPDRSRDRGIFVEDIHSAFTGDIGEPLMVLQGAVAFVLLIACSNVAGLLLARAAARRTEVSVRAALGALRGRMIRQLLTESVMLAVAGGLLGCGLAWAGLRMIVAAVPEGALPADNISISLTVLAYTAALSVFTGLVFGVLPALQTSKVDLATTLKESGRAGMDGSGRQRVRHVLVAAQVALALVLLIGAGLMMNTFFRLQSNELGADTRNLLTFEFRFPQSELMKPIGQFRGFGLWEINPVTALTFDRVHERVRTIPGVVSAAAISRPPLTGTMDMGFTIQGRAAPDPGGPGLFARYYAITPNYFATMKIPVLQGRDFAASDSSAAAPVAIVSKTMAERWWPNESPIGQYITLDFVPNEVPRRIVGIVGDTLGSRFQQQPEPTIYVPHIQQTTNWQGPSWNFRAAMYFVMRTTDDPGGIVPAVRSVVADIDPNKPAGNIRTVEGYLNDGLSEVRVFMMLLAVFGTSAAVLAALGLYGVMAYTVAQRTREIGIRVALGASSRSVVGLVVRQAVLLIAVGIAAGLAGAFALTRFLSSFLWQVSPTDPLTFTAVSLGLLLIAVVACIVPTRRATAVDPTVALRYE